MKVTFIPIVIGALGTLIEGLIKWLEDFEIRGRVKDYPNYCIIAIGQNTENTENSERPSANADVKNSKGLCTTQHLS